MKRVVILLCLLASNYVIAQLPIKDYFVFKQNYALDYSTIFNFDSLPKNEVYQLESKAKSYLKKLDAKNDPYKVASTYHYLFYINITLKRNDSALTYLYKTLELPKVQESVGEIGLRWGIFYIYKYAENYSGQLDQLNQLERLSKIYDDEEIGTQNLNKHRADILFTAGYYEDSRDYYNSFINDSLAFNPQKYAIINNDFAEVYAALRYPDSVKKYRTRAFKALKSKRKSPYNQAYVSYIEDFIKLHDFNYNKKFNDKTLNFGKAFLKTASKYFTTEIHTSIFANQFLANFFFHKKNYETALSYIERAIFIGEKRTSLRKKKELYVFKSRILDKLGRESQATATLNDLEKIYRDNQAINKNLDFIKYQVKQIEADKKNAELKAEQNQAKYQSTIYVSILLSLIIILIIAASLHARHKNKKIKQAQREISKKLEEKEFFLKELNHRVKNNLSLIISLVQFQSIDIEDQIFKDKLKHLENRINTISIAHEQFIYKETNSDAKFYDIELYLTKICNALVNLSTRKIKCDFHFGSLNVNIDTALPIGILINELVSNSIEHADLEANCLFLKMELSTDNQHIFIEYSDSGNGFENKKNSKSLGMLIIEGMIEQLKGSYTREKSTYSIKLRYKN